MAAERLSMRTTREILRLKWACQRSNHGIAQSCGIGRGAVAECLHRAADAGLTWPLPPELDDGTLEARLYRGPGRPAIRPLPDWAAVHQELRHPAVILQLLWQEYKASQPAGLQYSGHAWFGRPARTAVRAYREFLRAGIPQGWRPELVGGGLIRSLGGWAEVRAVRQRADRVLADERILGSGDFVEQMLRAGDARATMQHTRTHRLRAAQALVRQMCAREHLRAEELRMGGRRRRLSTVRVQLAIHLVTRLGLSLADEARHLGARPRGSQRRSPGRQRHKSTSSTT